MNGRVKHLSEVGPDPRDGRGHAEVSVLHDLSGMRFGRLIVTKRAPDRITTGGHHRVAWECVCDCGNIKIVCARELVSGKTRSCGCLHQEMLAKRNKQSAKHNEACKTRLYSIWSQMRSRCYYPKHIEYYRYGGRGITVCPEWDDYSVFKDWAISTGYIDSPECTIDRINNDEGYCPENCRWSSPVEQSNNRSSNVLLTYNGKTQTISQWAREVGLRRDTLAQRIKYGWDIHDALYTPVDQMRRRKELRV